MLLNFGIQVYRQIKLWQHSLLMIVIRFGKLFDSIFRCKLFRSLLPIPQNGGFAIEENIFEWDGIFYLAGALLDI